jgi:peptidoglycan hydrolase-like protein with peptidoglycan-binding domain
MRRTLTLSAALAAVALATALHVTPASAASYDPLVYRAQMALNAKGFDTGAPDGLFGPRTRTALQAWERASGVPATDGVTADTVARLEGSAVAPPRADRMPSWELIRQTQHELDRLGYNLTFEGGRLNGETSDAIRDYQTRHGLEANGMPSAQLLAALRADDRRVGPPVPPVQAVPAQPSTPTGYGAPLPPPEPVQCADVLHQARPGGSDYNGPPVPGCR